MYSPRAAIALLLTFSLFSRMVSTSWWQMSLSARGFSITVECLIKSPTTEQSLALMTGDLIYLSILTSRFMKAELINLLLTAEFMMILSK